MRTMRNFAIAVAAVKKTNGRIEMIDTINEELFNA